MSLRGVENIPAGASMVQMRGKLYLNPAIAPHSATSFRPLAPGEYIANPGGSWSSEITYGVNDPRLNGNAPTVVPTLWVKNGQAYRVTPQKAIELALASGIRFPSFPNWKEANQFTINREHQWDAVGRHDAHQVPALWETPPTTMAPNSAVTPSGARALQDVFSPISGLAPNLQAPSQLEPISRLGELFGVRR